MKPGISSKVNSCMSSAHVYVGSMIAKPMRSELDGVRMIAPKLIKTVFGVD